MKTDIAIAQEAKIKPITEIAAALGICAEELEPYGHYKAKLSEELFTRLSDKPDGKLVLVTAINPTPMGEGKTTISVGLGQAMSLIGKKAIIALREPSLGPVFGIKGGAAGGGYAQVVPMEDINLHFTGDMHAITSANNLLCALIDNHIHQGNDLQIDMRRILFKRCMDMNDRALREIVVGMGGKLNGFPRQDGFQITVASEVMAILCLALDLADLKERLGNILVAYTLDGRPVYARNLEADGAMAALLRDAIKPNLVQTLENTPAIMHGGPFANIAHGCNSIRATRLALKLGDYCVTEAGFGSDLGAEKFMDIKCVKAGLKPSAVVLVATSRALKYNGGVAKTDVLSANADALKKGLCNLGKHMENMRGFGVPVVVAINRFPTDIQEEMEIIATYCKDAGCRFAVSEAFANGGKGGEALANQVVEACEEANNFKPIYDYSLSIKEKVEAIATKIYGARAVNFAATAEKKLAEIEKLGKTDLPICMAKTQYSLSDNPALLGRPEGFDITVRDLHLLSGAGFIVVLTGDIMTMPGLPKKPAANTITVDANGNIDGLF